MFPYPVSAYRHPATVDLPIAGGLSAFVFLELAGVLVIGLPVLAQRVGLLGETLVVQDRVGSLLICVGGVFDERVLRLLEALGLPSPSLDDRTLGWIELLVAGDPPDAGGFGGCFVGLPTLEREIGDAHWASSLGESVGGGGALVRGVSLRVGSIEALTLVYPPECSQNERAT